MNEAKKIVLANLHATELDLSIELKHLQKIHRTRKGRICDATFDRLCVVKGMRKDYNKMIKEMQLADEFGEG